MRYFFQHFGIAKKKWLNVVFENKNQHYGAYALRKKYNAHVNTGLVIANGAFALLIVCYFLIINNSSSESEVPTVTMVAKTEKTEVDNNRKKTKPPKKDSLRMIELDASTFNKFIILSEKEYRAKEEARESALARKTSEHSINHGVMSYSLKKDGTQFNPQQSAAFPGGYGKFNTHILKSIKFKSLTKNFKYDNGDDEIDFEINTLVFVKCEVDEQGKMTNVELFKGGADPKFNDRVMEAFKQSPPWKPAFHKGKPVKQTLIVPFHFDYKQPLIKYYRWDT